MQDSLGFTTYSSLKSLGFTSLGMLGITNKQIKKFLTKKILFNNKKKPTFIIFIVLLGLQKFTSHKTLN